MLGYGYETPAGRQEFWQRVKVKVRRPVWVRVRGLSQILKPNNLTF